MQNNFNPFIPQPEAPQQQSPVFGHAGTGQVPPSVYAAVAQAPAPVAVFGVGVPSNSEDIYDANRRRLAFVCGFNEIELTHLESGQPTKFLPNGKLIKFVASQIRVPTYEIDDPEKPASVMQTFSAKFFLDTTITKLTREPDYGIRPLSMLVGLSYKESFENGAHYIYDDLADAYFNVVYPTVGERGAAFVCPEGLEDCPTCSWKWLNSQECQQRIAQAVMNSAEPHVLNELLKTLKESVTATLRHARIMWNTIVFDINQAKQDKPGKNVLNSADQHIRRMLHEVAPDMQQTNAIIEASRETGRAIAAELGNVIKHQSAPAAAPVEDSAELAELRAQNAALNETFNQVLPALKLLPELMDRLAAVEQKTIEPAADEIAATEPNKKRPGRRPAEAAEGKEEAGK